MKKTLFFIILIFSCFFINAQSVEIQGRVKSDIDVENIHVINKTAQVFTITSKDGNFNITVKLNDTLIFSSILYNPKEVIISKEIILNQAVLVLLDDKINTLDEVLVGKVLSGNLMSDIKNIDGKPPINFYDVGIPGYTGRIKTQSERRLSQAGEFKPEMIMGIFLGGGSLDAIINGISGRTKMLKNRVKIEEKEELMQSIKGRLAKDFFVSNPLENDLRLDFFYFCADDVNFMKYCKNQTDFKILIFLKMKYRQYLKNTDPIID